MWKSRPRLSGLTKATWFEPLLIGLVAGFAVLLTLDPATSYRGTLAGPGLTLDESFNVQMGVFLTRTARNFGLSMLDPDLLMDVFRQYNPDHPPLARWWLGIFHEAALTCWGPPAVAITNPAPALSYFTICARVGSAAAFALTVWLTGWFTTAHWGRCAGLIAASSLVLMPRVFGHAHLASLETVLNLVWSATIYSVAVYWSRGTRPSLSAAAGTGILMGGVFLTKMQAVLLPPLVVVWALWHWRQRAIKPLAMWLSVGAITFILCWPWLWLNFPHNLAAYFGRSTQRVVLHCWYLGQRFVDREVPWHYAAVMFAVTMPIGLLLLGSYGLWRSRREMFTEPTRGLVIGGWLAPLVLFSLPVAVYDGVRLFLICYPLWAVLIGIGGQALRDGVLSRWRRPNWMLAGLIALQSVGVIALRPYWLSYYSVSVGGLAGAERLGFEVSYWGDSMSRRLWNEVAQRVPADATIAVVPVMHQFYLRELTTQVPIVGERRWRIVPFEHRDRQTNYMISFRRLADLTPEPELTELGWHRAVTVTHQGVELATLWHREKQ